MTQTDRHSSLYARIGGAPAVEAAVDGLYRRILADGDLAPYFGAVDMTQLEGHQRAFLSVALGGPQRYDGRPMDRAHHGLGITPVAFGRVVAHLTETLADLGVDAAAITTIVDRLAPLETHIVATAPDGSLDG